MPLALSTMDLPCCAKSLSRSSLSARRSESMLTWVSFFIEAWVARSRSELPCRSRRTSSAAAIPSAATICAIAPSSSSFCSISLCSSWMSADRMDSAEFRWNSSRAISRAEVLSLDCRMLLISRACRSRIWEARRCWAVAVSVPLPASSFACSAMLLTARLSMISRPCLSCSLIRADSVVDRKNWKVRRKALRMTLMRRMCTSYVLRALR